ncbi:hypothetical protein G6L26_009605 [Agrobacterium radiobacter]|uniref:hypothetical protein n=1 Tax=Agrobacterium tumefaciens complex TaxID=1183400 RepID=UPI0011473B60|nr:hypothetical protein [Agrobacterium tumefaciens]NTA05440.1 hypothetical protein [Agrobacterium tumefaciens]NTA92033.1 hypothetical protein [Agrobacterium tumefaciens]
MPVIFEQVGSMCGVEAPAEPTVTGRHFVEFSGYHLMIGDHENHLLVDLVAKNLVAALNFAEVGPKVFNSFSFGSSGRDAFLPAPYYPLAVRPFQPQVRTLPFDGIALDAHKSPLG